MLMESKFLINLIRSNLKQSIHGKVISCGSEIFQSSAKDLENCDFLKCVMIKSFETTRNKKAAHFNFTSFSRSIE